MMVGMADRDPAFLWETEALRSVSRPAEPGRHVAPGSTTARAGWVTLRDASDATGIPVPTLRSWIRKKRLPSVLEENENGDRRLVPLDQVLARADQLGRNVDAGGPGRDSSTSPGASSTGAPPPGTMVVPIEAWDKMLIQLGNLHEAGQQLAEARERAARAETEAAFLRERLSEVRAERAAGQPSTAPAPPEPGLGASRTPTGAIADRPSFTVYLWESAKTRLRRL